MPYRAVGVVKLLLLTVGCMVAGGYVHKCQSAHGDMSGGVECVADTVRVYDTIPYIEPAPKAETGLGTVIRLFPVFIAKESVAENVPVPDTIADENIPTSVMPDTVAVEMPITQREYEGEDYRAWVSGYEPRLDSLYVYPRRETVTIRKPSDRAKRWGVGVFAGYGITPEGLKPCVGVSVHYTLWNL